MDGSCTSRAVCPGKHVRHPSSVVSVGRRDRGPVRRRPRQGRRISLSSGDPGLSLAGVADAHRVFELVYGRVTKLSPFGAFIQVGDGIEGLAKHISEWQSTRRPPRQVVTPCEEAVGEDHRHRPARRRISLSIKHAAEVGRGRPRVRRRSGSIAPTSSVTTSATRESSSHPRPRLSRRGPSCLREGHDRGAPEGAPDGGPPAPPSTRRASASGRRVTAS